MRRQFIDESLREKAMRRRGPLRVRTWIIALGWMAMLGSSFDVARAAPKADMVVLDGKLVTVSDGNPEAEALAIGGDRIIAVGKSDEIREFVGPGTRVLNAGGRLVTPGLIDSHVHLSGLGWSRQQLDLVGTKSEAQIAEMVRRRSEELPPGRWVLGRGWDQNDWADTQFPANQSISRAAPDRPVVLNRICGHACWANRKALEIAGIDRDTPDPPGGRILRDARGDATGVLIDAAESLVWSKVPEASDAEKAEALELALAECVQMGITGAHDAGVGRDTIALAQRMLKEERLPIRLYLMLSGGDQRLLSDMLAEGPRVGLGDHRLTIRAVKLFVDGALGSRGAAMFEPYSDEPDQSGLLILSEQQILAISKRALAAGYQVCTHAIGDRGNRITVNAYERAFRSRPDVVDHRFRIEHAQVLDAAEIPRIAELGLIASMQTMHCVSDMPWVHDRIGASRAREGAYLWRTLLEKGIIIANGSDAPVESVNPMLGIHAAITRQDHDGNPPGGWYPDERMTRTEVLRSFTLDAAYAAFEEEIKGSLEVGKLADLVVWSDDFLTAPPSAIPSTRADVTIVGGKIVYRRELRGRDSVQR